MMMCVMCACRWELFFNLFLLSLFLLARFGVTSAMDFAYLNHSGCVEIPGVDDADNFERMCAFFLLLHIYVSYVSHEQEKRCDMYNKQERDVYVHAVLFFIFFLHFYMIN